MAHRTASTAPANTTRHRNSPNLAFWKMLKIGNDHFDTIGAGRQLYDSLAAHLTPSALNYAPWPVVIADPGLEPFPEPGVLSPHSSPRNAFVLRNRPRPQPAAQCWGHSCQFMKHDLEHQREQALLAIVLSMATLVMCFGLLLLR